MIVIAVIVMMVVMMSTGTRVRAIFRIEGRLDGLDRCTEQTHHVLNHMIAPDQNAVGEKHDRQMPVSQVPRDANEIRRRWRVDLSKRLLGRNDANAAAVLQKQRIPVAKPQGARQIEQELKSILTGHRQTPPVPVIEIERHLVINKSMTCALRLTFNCAKHL